MRNLNSFTNRKKNYIERNECLVNFYSKNKRAKRDLNCSINRRKKKKTYIEPNECLANFYSKDTRAMRDLNYSKNTKLS
jgi:hypothetical protein